MALVPILNDGFANEFPNEIRHVVAKRESKTAN